MADKNDYIVFHKNTVDMAKEINKAIDDYWNRELSEIELKEYLWKVAGTGKLLKADSFSKMVIKHCGKARMNIIENLLQGYRNKF